jgi:predicted RecB family nuclease
MTQHCCWTRLKGQEGDADFMKRLKDNFELTASDLVGYLNCRHLTALDRAVALGTLEKPKVWDPLLEVLAERGADHEREYVEHLQMAGHEVVWIDGKEVTESAVSATLDAMRDRAEIIVQAALADEAWGGRADILRRVNTPSGFGDWSYEPIDTKLARETKAGAILQLCVYADLVGKAQGRVPEYMYVVAPWSEFQPQQYRFADYGAYFRKVKHALVTTVKDTAAATTYPDPIEHCEICRWSQACDQRRHEDDHLSLVAGISKLQINELTTRGMGTVQSLAAMPIPLDWKPGRGSADSFVRVREQARILVENSRT